MPFNWDIIDIKKHMEKDGWIRMWNYYIYIYISPPPMPPHVLMNFCGFPPGCGDGVANFWGWDAHEAQLRCPDDVRVVIE